MSATTIHWAAHLVGEPWTPERNCWWLVCEFFRLRCGLAMPHVSVGDLSDHALDNVAAIKRTASSSGWRRIEGEPREDDVLVMTSPFHRRHVGVVVFADGALRMLHNEGRDTSRGPVGCVVAQPIEDALRDVCGPVEIWRRAC
jgi:hypothetical protein